jgi:hypothetical protein
MILEIFTDLSQTEIFLAYFPKMKVGLSITSLSVCVSLTNNFRNDGWIFMKFGRQVMLLKMTSTPHFLNLVASAIRKGQTFNLLWWVQLLNRLVDLDEILYGGDGIEYCLL